MRHIPVWTAIIISALFLTVASAAAKIIPIQNLPDMGIVTLSGTVQKIKNPREFTLRDNSGTIDVRLPNGKSAVLNEGDSVSIIGTVNSGHPSGKDIRAYSVKIDQRTGV